MSVQNNEQTLVENDEVSHVLDHSRIAWVGGARKCSVQLLFHALLICDTSAHLMVLCSFKWCVLPCIIAK